MNHGDGSDCHPAMVLAAQEGLDQAMHSVPREAMMGEAPQSPSAAESLGEIFREQLVPLAVCSLTLLQELRLCFLAAFPAVKAARKSLKSNFLPKSG